MLSVLQEKLPEIRNQEQNLTRYDVYRGNPCCLQRFETIRFHENLDSDIYPRREV